MISTRLFAAAFAVLVCSASSMVAHAQPKVQSTLDLTLDTETPSTPTPRFYKNRSSLSSRGALVRREAPRQQVLGKLAVVSSDGITIRRGRDNNAALLSKVGKGTYLAVVSEVGDHYGVLMIDKSTGWVAKNAVRMIDYQVAVGAAQPSAPVTSATASSYDQLPEGLDARTAALLREAFSYLGVRYVWAGNTRSGVDCSGFVKNVFATQGVSLPRHSGDQARVGMPVAWEDLQAGDRLYFDMGRKGRVSHTGIYLGNGYFIHASTNQKKVGVDSILKSNYYKALVGARRS